MPKRIHIPPYIRDFEVERITEAQEKPILPLTFEENFSVNLPYTIPARSRFSFSYTFPSKPSEILLTDVHRFGEASTNEPDYDYSQLKFGKVTISIVRGSHVYLFDGTHTKLFWWGTEGELSEGVLTQSEYASTPSSSTFFGHSPEQNHSHICHVGAFGKKIVLKGYTVEGNTLKVNFFNEESTPVILDKFTTTEPRTTTNKLIFPADSNDLLNQGICAFGDKIMIYGDAFIRRFDGNWITDTTNNSNIYIINSNYNSLDNDTGTEKIIMSPEHAYVTVDQGNMASNITYMVGYEEPPPGQQPETSTRYNFGAGACVKHNDANEYFAAFMVGYLRDSEMRFLLYDSETERWELKNSDSFQNKSSSIYTAPEDKINSRHIGKKPMDIKHFASTGNVHAMVSGFTGNYEPKIIYSNTSMETWTTLFTVGDLSTVNSNIIDSSVSTIDDEASEINRSLFSKIIDEKTMLSEFCTYVNSYDFGFDSNRAQVNVLIRTDDGGSTWTDVMQDHPEYTLSPNLCNYISDNGSNIYTMIFYGAGQDVEGHDDSRNNIYPDGDKYQILFNYSTNGGTTWAYPSGSWKVIDSIDDDTSQNFTEDNSFRFKAGTQRFKHQCAIYHNIKTNEIIVVHPGLGSENENLEVKISRDNGQTWVNPYSPAIEDFESHPNYTYGSTSGGIVPYIAEQTITPPNIFSGNDLFAAFNIYTGGQDISNISSAFSVHDWIFESTSYGYTSILPEYEDSRKFTSSLLVTHTNESAKITRLKGYSV